MFIHDLFGTLKRQGPGDSLHTKKAWDAIVDIHDKPLILDIGCGTGTATLDLLKLSSGRVTAVDDHQPFLDSLMQKARTEGVEGNLEVMCESMFDLDFPSSSFDLIWSEGAIYIYGFERGFTDWKKFLKSGGHIVVSELCWLRSDMPEELLEYWNECYPEIADKQVKIAQIQDAGFEVVSCFELPALVWWESMYAELEKKLPQFIIEHVENEEAQEFARETQFEIDMFRKYSDYFGYIFYVAKKP